MCSCVCVCVCCAVGVRAQFQSRAARCDHVRPLFPFGCSCVAICKCASRRPVPSRVSILHSPPHRCIEQARACRWFFCFVLLHPRGQSEIHNILPPPQAVADRTKGGCSALFCCFRVCLKANPRLIKASRFATGEHRLCAANARIARSFVCVCV